jgi:hypothetical protein
VKTYGHRCTICGKPVREIDSRAYTSAGWVHFWCYELRRRAAVLAGNI